MTLRFIRYTGAALASLMLMSCSHLPPFPSFIHPHARPVHARANQLHVPADAFVRCLTLARLAADAQATDAACLHQLDTYTARTPEPATQAVLVLNYKDRHSDTPQLVLAPVPAPDAAPTWDNLLAVMKRTEAAPYTLSDLHLSEVIVAPQEPLHLTGADSDTQRQALDEQQQDLLDSADTLPPMEEAREQMRLIDFFIDHRFRDAAYLSVDNMKRLLAATSEKQSEDAEEIKVLSQQLEALEARLHKALPYTLSGSPPHR